MKEIPYEIKFPYNTPWEEITKEDGKKYYTSSALCPIHKTPLTINCTGEPKDLRVCIDCGLTIRYIVTPKKTFDTIMEKHIERMKQP